jgi:hypothetical protein
MLHYLTPELVGDDVQVVPCHPFFHRIPVFLSGNRLAKNLLCEFFTPRIFDHRNNDQFIVRGKYFPVSIKHLAIHPIGDRMLVILSLTSVFSRYSANGH